MLQRISPSLPTAVPNLNKADKTELGEKLKITPKSEQCGGGKLYRVNIVDVDGEFFCFFYTHVPTHLHA